MSRRKQLVPLWGVLVLTGGIIAFFVFSAWNPNALLVEQWRSELISLEDEMIPEQIDQIASSGDIGLPLLVEAIASRREVVARSARSALSEQIDRWRMMRTKQSTPKVAKLAQLLSEHAEKYSPEGKIAAGNIARQLLIWPLDKQSDAGELLVDHCEKVLEMAALDSSQLQRREINAGRIPNDQSPKGAFRQVEHREPLPSASDLPGGGLPIEITNLPSLPPVLEEQQELDRSPANTPMRLKLFQKETETEGPPPKLKRAIANKLPQNGVSRKQVSPQAQPPTQDSASSVTGMSSTGDTRSSIITSTTAEKMDDLDLMRLLHSDVAESNRNAKQELSDRGFREMHFELAKRLTSLDPNIRRELALNILRVPDINPQYWLFILSHDQDVRVRRAVVGVIAGSQDPLLRDRLKEIATQSNDPVIREQLEKMLR